MRKYLVVGLFLVVLCLGAFLVVAPAAPGSNLSSAEILVGVLTVGFCLSCAVVVVAWFLSGCPLG